MATENIPQIDRALKEWGQAFRKVAERTGKDLKQLQENRNQLRESEGKTMTHNVEITTTEIRGIEEYWVMRGIKENVIVQGRTKQVFKEQELTHNPTLQEIAQFLSESNADFVSVEHNYRFADLPFC